MNTMNLVRLVLVGLAFSLLSACGGDNGDGGRDSDHTIGGTLTGLSGALVVQNNGGDDLTLTADGDFRFSMPIAEGDSYNVTVLTQPNSRTCTVSNGAGTVSAEVSDVAINCVLPSPAPPTLSYDLKTFRFSWPAVENATHYRLLENPDGNSGYSQIGGDILTTAYDHAITVSLWQRLNASYMLQACDAIGCSTESAPVFTSDTLVEAIGYFKASNTDPDDRFGYSVSLSSDGSTLAIGALEEQSNSAGIDGEQMDNSAESSGAVYIFLRSGNTWTQQAYIKASNADPDDFFGRAVALSADGNTLAVGADGEASASTTINAGETDNTASSAGAVYVFNRSNGVWSQQAYIKASNAEKSDRFGWALALSDDGRTLAVSARSEDSNAQSINGDQTNNDAPAAGAVYIFTRSEDSWTQSAYLKAANAEENDLFGIAVSLSASGDTLTVGAPLESSATTGVNGEATNNNAGGSGAVYVFIHADNMWSQQAYIKASNTDADDAFGTSVALSGDGNTLAISAFGEDSAAVGVNGNHLDNSVLNSGAVYVFIHSNSTWVQQAYLKASHVDASDFFGSALIFSADGNTLAIGARQEDSAATGINSDQLDNMIGDSGAAYVFTRSDDTWSQEAYLKATHTGISDNFGVAIALSSDGNTLAIGARGEDGADSGINGDHTDNNAESAGAVYLY